MLNKKLLAILLIAVIFAVCAVGLAACADQPDNTDIPSDNGADKPNDGEVNNPSDTDENTPIFAEDNKTVQYGLYPQTHVSDEALIAELNKLTASETNGWFVYDGNYYAKQTANVYNDETYTFDDGTAIVNGQDYWFKCEPITWQVIKSQNGTYDLVSAKLLDAHNYYSDYANRTIDGSDVYANNYAQSDVRNWLNGYFFNTAFVLGSSHIQQTAVDNGAATTDKANNSYVCANTSDKVYLPSYAEYLNADNGFDENPAASKSRQCKTTDY